MHAIVVPTAYESVVWAAVFFHRCRIATRYVLDRFWKIAPEHLSIELCNSVYDNLVDPSSTDPYHRTAATERDKRAFFARLPEAFQTTHMYADLVAKYGTMMLREVPRKHITVELCAVVIAMNRDCSEVMLAAPHMLTEDNLVSMFSLRLWTSRLNKGTLFDHLPPSMLTEKTYLAAVPWVYYSSFLKEIPEAKITVAIAVALIEKHIGAYAKLPPRLQALPVVRRAMLDAYHDKHFKRHKTKK
jgi:hypothetical protein